MHYGARLLAGNLLHLLGILLITFPQPLRAQQVPFNRGVNLSGWFQVSDANQIQFTRYNKHDFEQIKSLGCDVIRLPINLHYMTDGAPDYSIQPIFFEFLDSVVNWAEELEIHLILDNHTFDPAVDTDPNIGSVLMKVWSQMALHYRDRSDFIYYEILNEPHGISDALWNTIQQQVVQTIREIDTRHYIVVGPANWNSYNNLGAMPVYTDTKLIYTFHFYDPFIFTHQGASWVNPSMVPLGGVPFPYFADSMPVLPSSLAGTWIESAFNDYPNTGNVASVTSLLDIAIQFRNNRNVPVFCGEYGVYIPNSSNNYRVHWYNVVRKYLEKNNIPWTTWDYHGGFGLFKKNGNDMFEHDLNVPLLDSLGLIVPEQTAYIKNPDSTGFMLYTDYIGNQISESSYGSGIPHYYAKDKPNNGKYCIYWSGAELYNTIGFDFLPDKDMTELVSEGYALDFMVRGNAASTSFDVRFLDTKTDDPADHPWRMRYTINSTNCTFDNYWHHLHIPLSIFTEEGAWDNGWFNPEGKYDWKAVDRMEIATEQQSLVGKDLWFDNIHVTNLDTAQVYVNTIFSDVSPTNRFSRKLSVYPNPARDFLCVSSDVKQPITIKLSDNLGRNRISSNFEQITKLDVSILPAGIYYLSAWGGNELIDIQKVVIF
jgi:endoglucanase